MEQRYTTPVTFSDEQWRACQDAIWHDLEVTNEYGNQLQARVDTECDETLHKRPYHMLTDSQKAEIDSYWETMRQLSASRDRENALLGLLEGIEEGTAVPADVMPFLPQAEEDQTPASTYHSAEVEESWFGVMDVVIPATDPTRISSGRNRKMLKTVGGMAISTHEAEGLFYEQTADTHGGKVRRPGKNGKYYKKSASGKRIRKY